jgi:divalent metal cation (Fe/Co/Zn/Cd) transporter
MFRKGYLLRLIAAFAVMGIGLIVGWIAWNNAIESYSPLLFGCGYVLFGIGSALAVYTEQRKVDEGLVRQVKSP